MSLESKKTTENNIKSSGLIVYMARKRCDSCKGRLIETKDIVISQGRSAPISVKECTKCGETFSSLKEAERVRKELHPSFLGRIKTGHRSIAECDT
jgi:hypothetical protein